MRAAVVVLVGCGRVGFDAVPDASVLSITPLSVLNTADREDDPALSGDMLEIFFDVRDDAIWTSRRASLTSPWEPPTRIVELDAVGFGDTNCEISADGLTLYFGSKRPGAGLNDLWVATRTARDATWSPPTRLVELATPADEVPGGPDATHTTMVFARDLTLYETSRPDRSAPWNPAVATSLAIANAASGFLDPTGSVVAFEGTGADGTIDVFIATRGPSGFDAPIALDAIDVGANDRDPWISCDGRHLFFASDRLGGRDDLFEAILPEPLWTPRC